MLKSILIAGLCIRIGIAAWNGFWGPSYGADLDALGFHIHASEFAQNPSFDALAIGWVYVLFLGSIYWLLTDSVFLGSLISCAAWLASALILVRCLNMLQGPRGPKELLLACYCFLPSSVMWTAVTLREPFQLLFLNLATLAALHIVAGSRRHWAHFAAAVVGAGFLHGALLLGMVASGAALLMLQSYRKRGFVISLKSFAFALLSAATLLVGVAIFNEVSYGAGGNVIESAGEYQQALVELDARTNYKEPLPVGDPLALVSSIVYGFVQYLFEPYPWRISAASDVITAAENAARLVFLLYAIRLFSHGHHIRSRIFFLWALFTCLAIELIWSVGTVNWGTAMRHHLPTIGLLVLAAYGGISLKRASRRQARALVGTLNR